MPGTGFSGSGLLGRLYRGETRFDFIGSRKRWYAASAVIIAICILSIALRGFNFGIDFAGGDSYQLPVRPGVTLADVRGAVTSAGIDVSSAQTAGAKGSTTSFVIDTEHQPQATVDKIKANLVTSAHLSNPNQITTNQVSKSWGGEVTRQAVIALIVFLVVVSAFIAVRFQEWRMALAAVLALIHDLLLTAGVYSLVGFEVSPSTVVGLLTILGFSLYDTVVVFDKVAENSKGILSTTRMTYPEAANLAVNQTLMRSINTSIIGLLPVAGLLFVGAGLLGVGTLEDLALVLFVGMLTGAYSSLFLATPWLVDFKLMDPRYRNHVERVAARRLAVARGETGTPTSGRRKTAAKSAKPAGKAEPKVADVDASGDAAEDTTAEQAAAARENALASTGGSTPRVGAKPSTKRNPGSRPSGNRPGGNRRR
jgi:preprotein translocase subunit SecF